MGDIKKTEFNSRITWALLAAAVILHVSMITRAVYITWDLHALSQSADARQHSLSAILQLTNTMRQAEESIRQCSVASSARSRRAYCSGLRAADSAAVAAVEAGAVSTEFTATDMSELRASLAAHLGCCLGEKPLTRAAAAAEFDRFYSTASSLRNKLAAYSRAGLQHGAELSGEARAKTAEMVYSSSVIATFILALMAWIVYSMRKMNLAIAEQRDEILILKHGIEQSPLGVVLTDTAGKIEYVNAAFTAMHGYAREEVFGKNPRVLKSGETPLAMYEGMWKTLLNKKPWTGELHNKSKDGRLLWVRADLPPRNWTS